MREKTRAGFEAVKTSYKHGHYTRYVDKATGENISRRQYLKRSEQIKSLESKSKALRMKRLEEGTKQPMTRYNRIVKQYKLIHPNAKVRGDSKEARHFRKLFEDLKKPLRGKRSELRRFQVLKELGVITEKQRYDYANRVLAYYK